MIKYLTPAYRNLELVVVSLWLAASAVHAADDSVVVVGEPAPIASRTPAASTDCIRIFQWR